MGNTDSTVNVVGMPSDGMGGLKESLGAFRKHHKYVGDALLNISGVGTATGEPVDKDEARPVFEHQAYPAMRYHADGRHETVANEEADKAIRERGFRSDPYPQPHVHLNDPKVEKAELLEANRQLRAQVATMADGQTKLLERLDALEKKQRR